MQLQTIILFGSPRRSGSTHYLAKALESALPGHVTAISAYDTKVSPCTDCRYCWRHPACAIRDSMSDVYEAINGSDCIVVASPIYFHSLPGPLKALVDRCQVYWAERLRKDGFGRRKRSGTGVFVGGAPPFERQFLGGELVVDGLLRELGAEAVSGLRYADSDRNPLAQRPGIQRDIGDLAQRLVSVHGEML